MSWWLSWPFVVESFRVAIVWLLNVYLRPVLLFNDKCVFVAMPRLVHALFVIYLFTFSSVIYIRFCKKISFWRHLHQSSKLIYRLRVVSIFSFAPSTLPSSSLYMWYCCPVFYSVSSMCCHVSHRSVLISLIIYCAPLLYHQSLLVTRRFFKLVFIQ